MGKNLFHKIFLRCKGGGRRLGEIHVFVQQNYSIVYYSMWREREREREREKEKERKRERERKRDLVTSSIIIVF